MEGGSVSSVAASVGVLDGSLAHSFSLVLSLGTCIP